MKIQHEGLDDAASDYETYASLSWTHAQAPADHALGIQNLGDNSDSNFACGFGNSGSDSSHHGVQSLPASGDALLKLCQQTSKLQWKEKLTIIIMVSGLARNGWRIYL